MADLGSIESIESLARDMRVEDGLFFVNFEAPDDGESVPAVVAVESSNKPTVGAETSAKEPFYFSLIRSANGLARDILGYNATVLGTTTAIDSKLDEAKEDAEASDKPKKQSLEELTDEEREDALFRAFEQVMHRFAWDPTTDQWVIVHEARGLGSELQRQLKLAPLETKADREVLTQMALEVASADGEIDREEQEVLLDFVDRDKVVQGPSTARARVTQNDLRRTTSGATRETLFMLAAAVALADHKFDLEESDRLEFYAKGLNLEEHRAAELLEAAQKYFIEQYMVRRFAETGELDEDAREGVTELAEKIGYEPDQAELAFERYRRVQESGGGFSSGLSW